MQINLFNPVLNMNHSFFKCCTLLLCMYATTSTFSQKVSATFYDYKWQPCEVPLASFYSTLEKTDSGWLRYDYFMGSKKLQMKALYRDSLCKIYNGQEFYFYANGNLEASGLKINNKKEGIYLSYHFNGMMKDSGNFHNDEIVGYQLSWHSNGMLADSVFRRDDSTTIEVSWFDNGNPSSAGYYINNKKHGRWNYFHKNGNPAAAELNDHGKVVSVSYFNEDNSPQTDTSNRTKDEQFKGGIRSWQEYLAGKTYWPQEYKITNSNKATVVVAFVLTEEGKVEDVHVVTPFHRLMDDIAMDAIKKSPLWKPRLDHNRKIKQYLRQPVTFLQDQQPE
jgi:Gram-negative bacterial TonB protein C-terminal